MNIESLKNKLALLDIPKIYSISKEENSKFCLVQENNFWFFFKLENNKRKFLKFFENEIDATTFFLNFMEDNFKIEKEITFIASVAYKDIFLINNFNIWNMEWNQLNRSFLVKDPKYHNMHLFNFRIHNEKSITLIAGEFSNNIWFFLI